MTLRTTSGGVTPYGTIPCPLVPLAAVNRGTRVSRLGTEPQESNRCRTFSGTSPPLVVEQVASIPGRGRWLDWPRQGFGPLPVRPWRLGRHGLTGKGDSMTPARHIGCRSWPGCGTGCRPIALASSATAPPHHGIASWNNPSGQEWASPASCRTVAACRVTQRLISCGSASESQVRCRKGLAPRQSPRFLRRPASHSSAGWASG